MENSKNKKSVKFQGDMLNFCDFIQVFVFTRNHHLNSFLEHMWRGKKMLFVILESINGYINALNKERRLGKKTFLPDACPCH